MTVYWLGYGLVDEYVEHCHATQNHQSTGNRLIETNELESRNIGRILSNSRFPGMLKYDYRSAA